MNLKLEKINELLASKIPANTYLAYELLQSGMAYIQEDYLKYIIEYFIEQHAGFDGVDILIGNSLRILLAQEDNEIAFYDDIYGAYALIEKDKEKVKSIFWDNYGLQLPNLEGLDKETQNKIIKAQFLEENKELLLEILSV